MSVSQGAPSERRAPAGPKDIARECIRACLSQLSQCTVSLTTLAYRAAAEDCWFCLSNPQVTKHLIASIGSETYLTLPKGQLIDTSDAESCRVPGGGHCLIIPVRSSEP